MALTYAHVGCNDARRLAVDFRRHQDSGFHVRAFRGDGQFVIGARFDGVKMEIHAGVRAGGADVVDVEPVRNGDADDLGRQWLAGLPEEEGGQHFDGVLDQDPQGEGGLIVFRVVGFDGDGLLIKTVAIEGLE